MVSQTHCQFWSCEKPLPRLEYLCQTHLVEYRNGHLGRCQGCLCYKPFSLTICSACGVSTPVREAEPTPEPLQTDSRRLPTDKDTTTFFVYILIMDGGEYYIGQTRELHERLHEHRNGMTRTTRNRNPKLMWFTEVSSRSEALAMELRLQRINAEPASRREITRMITRFARLVSEIDGFKTQADRMLHENPGPYRSYQTLNGR